MSLQLHLKCICSAHLIEISNTRLYSCDSCDKEQGENEPFWHCSDEYNLFHPDGYDLCTTCAHQCKLKSIADLKSEESDDHKTPNEPNSHSCNDVKACQILKHFINLMNKHQDDRDIDGATSTVILNDYLHLMDQHDDDTDFEYIFNALGICHIAECKAFKRRYRRRLQSDNTQYDGDECKDECIIDKIHCYFLHSYDMGHRLSASNRQSGVQNNDEPKRSEAIQAMDIIHKQRERIRKIFPKLNDNSNNKYDQIFTETVEDEKDDRDGKYYGFGIWFKYGYNGEDNEDTEMAVVNKKYASLKEELTHNPLCTLTIAQYNSEYKKAEIHHNSAYCKGNKSFGKQKHGYHNEELGHVEFTFHMKYVLALMIYCNYDHLQYEFSKTYRDNNGVDHVNFYHLGRFLKISVHQFGVNIDSKQYDGVRIGSFYHGVSEQMYLPKYVYTPSSSIYVYGPLSTTTSFPVAVQFAGGKGFVVDLFADNTPSKKLKCFSTAWLSDYPNEKEHLFLQNDRGFEIVNITNLTDSIDHKSIFTALKIVIYAISYDQFGEDFEDLIKEINSSMMKAIWVILAHQMTKAPSNTNGKYKALPSMKEYGDNILDSSFGEIDSIDICYWRFKQYCGFMSEFFMLSECEWVNVKSLQQLFPNVSAITMNNIAINSFIFEDILKHFALSTKLIKITIKEPKKISSEFTIQDAIHKYHESFAKIGTFICSSLGSIHGDSIEIAKMNKAQIVSHVIGAMIDARKHRAIYYEDNNGRIEKMMQELVEHKLNSSSTDDIDVTIEQKQFTEYCKSIQSLRFDGKKLKLTNRSYLWSVLCAKKHAWINLTNVIKLFPECKSIDVESLKLNRFVIEDLLKHIKEDKSKLNLISLNNLDEEQYDTMDAEEEYEDAFKDVSWLMEYHDRNEENDYEDDSHVEIPCLMFTLKKDVVQI
eukprot:97483_1